jgi:hypothetical protein
MANTDVKEKQETAEEPTLSKSQQARLDAHDAKTAVPERKKLTLSPEDEQHCELMAEAVYRALRRCTAEDEEREQIESEIEQELNETKAKLAVEEKPAKWKPY